MIIKREKNEVTIFDNDITISDMDREVIDKVVKFLGEPNYNTSYNNTTKMFEVTYCIDGPEIDAFYDRYTEAKVLVAFDFKNGQVFRGKRLVDVDRVIYCDGKAINLFTGELVKLGDPLINWGNPLVITTVLTEPED